MKKKSQQTWVGIVLGAAVGVALGVAAGHVAIWIAIGVAIGMALGSTVRRKAIDCPQCASVHQRTKNENLQVRS
jgi:uncharacterized membrane protein YoaK (UPF0700 family)